MSLNKFVVLFLMITFSTKNYSQENVAIKKDSLTAESLETVVITAQYSQQSVKKSVFEVTVIDRKQIESQAGNNLADVLNQTLNLNIIPSNSTGKSSVQMFGLDSQYFKILVDDVPLINDEGFGNMTDLTQINLDDIQQIEIVEGAAGVQYGANAVSGVINIITKKKSKYKWSINPYIQEETIGGEYNLSNKGRHIQSVKLGHNFSDKWFANATYTRNNFNGFYDDKQGQHYELNDGLRGYSWLPKLQNTAKLLLNYKSDSGFKSFYKFEYFTEQIDKYSEIVDPNFNPSTNTTNPIAEDDIFSTERMYHLLNINGKIQSQINYNVSLSYQQQKRNLERYNYYIKLREKYDVRNYEYESREVFYSKGNFSNFLKSEKFNFQLGYEVSEMNGFTSSVAGDFDGQNIKRKLGSYDVFTSAEWHLNDRFSLRPGIRLMNSSKFTTQTAVSLSSRVLLKNRYQLRFVVGTSPRLPNYEELYTYFVDANHDVRGNENLNPEQGKSIFIHLKKRFQFKDIHLQSKLSLNYIDVSDRIETVIINESPLQYQYINIDSYRTTGMFLRNSFKSKKISGSLGLSYLGVSKVLDSNLQDNQDLLFAFGLNANLTFDIQPLKSKLSVFYKYNGETQQIVQESDEVIRVGKQDAYSMLDASVRRKFLKKKLDVTLGARNLLDITQVNTTASEGTTHSAAASSILLGYGRSYFIKLQYNLNFN